MGGGYAAAEESVFLTRYAKHVTILMRSEDFTCAGSTADAAKKHEKITVLPNTSVISVKGDTALRSLKYQNTKTGEITEYKATDLHRCLMQVCFLLYYSTIVALVILKPFPPITAS